MTSQLSNKVALVTGGASGDWPRMVARVNPKTAGRHAYRPAVHCSKPVARHFAVTIEKSTFE
jgi:hypothetical protein